MMDMFLLGASEQGVEGILLVKGKVRRDWIETTG